MMNEMICATAIYYFDSENVTPSHLYFRGHVTPFLKERLNGGQASCKWFEQVLGTSLQGDSEALQNHGEVETRVGRLIAFPSVL